MKMKKIINGKVYDTETAECLHTWSNSYYRSDFRWCEESLYQTPKGAYFIAGEGGPMSSYAEPVGGNARGAGRGLRPVTEAEAIRWLEEHDGDDVLLERFKDKIEEA